MSAPAWLDAHVPLKPEQEATPYGATNDEELLKRSRLVFWGCKIATISLCLLMMITALIGFSDLRIGNMGRFFVALYMLFFSILLVTFEIIQVKHHENMDFMYKRNFGFLYDPKAKAFFIIFIAFLSFGLDQPEGLSIATGVLFCALGAIELALYLKYPEYFNYKLEHSSSGPSATSSGNGNIPATVK